MLLTLLVVFVNAAVSQELNVTGIISDESGAGIPFTSVLQKGTQHGVSADEKGNYNINAKKGSVLIFTATGYQAKEVIVTGALLNVMLIKNDNTVIDEVVVTGVGTATSKRKLGISVESVTSKDLPKVSTASIDQALVGKIAGAQISSISGQPGQQASILLRGINTLSSTQPMILIDGVQLQAGNNVNGSGSNLSSRLSDIDLSNVERIEVVQGSAAATIYGAQGANGVIQIFTKKGARNGKTRVTLNSGVAFDNVLRGKLKIAEKHFSPVDAQGYIVDPDGQRIQPDPETGVWTTPEIVLNAATVNDRPFMEKTYDHVDQLFKKNAMTLNNSVNLAGGWQTGDYNLNVANTKQQSVIFGDYGRTNLSLGLGFEVFKNFNIRTNSQLIFSDNSTGGITGQNDINSSLGTALNTKQYYDITAKDANGNYVVNQELDNSINPFYNNQFREYAAKTTRIIQGINLNYKPFKFLELDYKYGIDNYKYHFRNFIKYQLNTLTPGVGIDPLEGSITLDRDNQTLQNSLITAFIRTNLQEDFNVSIPLSSITQIAYDWRKDAYENVVAIGTGFAPYPPYSLSTANNRTNEQTITDKITYGYLINQKFEYGNLFGISGGVRVDYSSAFGSGSKPFVFPRGDVYFRISDLLKSQKLYDLKLRAAYGEAGIQPGAYDRFITLNSGLIGSNSYLSLKATARNPLLNVEVSKEFEGGFDLGFKPSDGIAFSDVKLSATYWNRKSNDVIRAIDLAPSSGSLAILTNALSLASSGLQFALDMDVLKLNQFDWRSAVRFGTQKSAVSKISNGKDIVIGGSGSGQFVLREGESVGAFFGTSPLSSISQTNSAGTRYIPEANAANYEVVNGIVVNKTTKAVAFTNEQLKIGDPTPKFNMSFINDFTILKNFIASFQIDWVYGNQVYNQTKQWLYRDWLHGDFDVPVNINGENKPWANYYNSLYNTNQTNSYFVEDGSFVRLRNLSLAYNIPFHNNNIFKNAQFSVSGRNLMTWTKYTGFDPEAAANLNDPTTRGLDLYAFPNFKTIQFGLTLGF